MDLTPKGCSSIGGELAYRMERARGAALDLFATYGYAPFNPAEFQLLDTAMKELPRKRRERMIVVNTPLGEPCCLRADISISALSYSAAHYAPEDFPVRLCYAERIFSAPIPPRESLEATQIGAELLGWENIGSDVEILSMLFSTLDHLGLDDARVVLGDSAILPRLTRDLPAALASELIESLQNAELNGYSQKIEDSREIDGSLRKILLELPWLKGGIDVLSDASKLVGGNALFDLTTIVRALSHLGWGERVSIDLGFIRDLNYYTGPIFNIYSSGDGNLLGGGGRYAGELSGSSLKCEAVGFGLDLREIAASISGAERRSVAVVWAGGASAEIAMKLAHDLADRGRPFVISWTSDRERSIERAREHRAGAWIDAASGECLIVETSSRTSVDDFIKGARS